MEPDAAVPAEWWPAVVETAFAAAESGAAVLDRELRYRYVNGALAALNGVAAAEHLGRTVREVIPAWAEAVEPLLRRVVDEGTSVTGMEISGLGNGRTYSVGYHPLRVDGRVEGVVGLVADVTETRAAEAALREQEALFALLMDNVPQAFFYVVDPAGPRLRYVSPAYERIFARPVAELYEDPGAWMRSVHPEDAPRLRDRIGVGRGGPTDVEYRVVLADGGVRRVRDRAFPVRDDAGEVRWIAGVGEDVTDAHAAAERRAVLAAAGDALASSLDADETLRAAAELLVPRLGDYCMIFTPGADGAFSASVWRHVDPALERTVARFAALHRVRGDEPGSMLAHAVATGETLVQAEVDVEQLATTRLGDPERAALMRELGPRSVLISGLSARGQRLGVLLLVSSTSGRRYGPADEALVRQLAERIALAMDNARLYGAEHAARAAAEIAVERGRALQRVGAALNRAATPAEVAAVVVDEGRRVLRADAGSMALVDEGAGEFLTLYSVGFAEQIEARYRRFPLRPGGPLSHAVLSRQPVFVASGEAMEREFPRMAAATRESGMSALATLPLVSAHRVLAGLTLGFRQPRAFDPDDRTFLAILADLAAQALDRARVYEAEQASRRAAERSAGRAEALRRMAAALNQAASTDEVARVIAEDGARALNADAASLAAVNAARTEFETLALTGWDAGTARRYARFPLLPGRPTADTVLRREPLFIQSLDEMRARYPDQLETLERGGLQAFAALPLFSGGRAVAVVSYSFRAPRVFDAEERTFLLTLTEQAAQALDRARLYEAEQATRRAAERSAQRAEALREIAAALNRAASADEVARVIADDGLRALDAQTAAVTAVDAERTEFEMLAISGYDTPTVQQYARFPLRPGGPSSDAVLRGEPVFVQSLDEMRARYPEQIGILESVGLHAFAALPLFSGEQAASVVSYGFRAPRDFDADERTFLLTLAGQASQALERARLYEAERAARAEAEAANRAKTEFLAVMSHELRTPLNAIDGYAELLEMGLRGPVTEAQQSDLARIRRSQRHLLGLINDVLNFARVEAGHVELAIADVPLAEVLEGLEALVAPQVMERGLAYDCPPADPSLVARADAEKVRQILLNLLSNAVKFTPAGGTVRVTAGAEDGRVRIRVRDTGAGIPPDRLESIFEPFVQLDRNLTSAHQGTGLGLAISRDLARAMGGDLAAESVPGQGSVFTLSLPRAEAGG